MLDGGAPFYEVYETSDGKYMAVGALESQFYQVFVERLGLKGKLANQYDVEQWPAMKDEIQAVFLMKTRDEWTAIFEDCDACVSPVLEMREARQHPHNRARGSFVERDGIWQPRTAPRFSRTDGGEAGSAVPVGYDTKAILTELGYGDAEQQALLDSAAVSAADD